MTDTDVSYSSDLSDLRHPECRDSNNDDWIFVDHYDSDGNIIEDENHQQEKPPPGEDAHVDDQGSFQKCTRNAIGKAITDGCMKKIFVKNLVIDLSQKDVVGALDGTFKLDGTDKDRKHVIEFYQKEYQFTERFNSKIWKITLKDVQVVNKEDFLKDMMQKVPNNTYVAVYLTKRDDPKSSHCVYVQTLLFA